MEEISNVRVFQGQCRTIEHDSKATGTTMRFAVYTPDVKDSSKLPVLYWLSGLTCTEENFIQKAGAFRALAEENIMLVAPDTSPRGEGVADEPDCWWCGKGAGFYVDATESPWSSNYKMFTYISEELPDLVAAHYPADPDRQSIFGHSMGGHGALTIGLRHPQRYRSISAFAPIASASRSPWGIHTLSRYLGPERQAWQLSDATSLVAGYQGDPLPLLVDQGEADPFLEEQLKTGLLIDACKQAGYPAEIRMQPGYDHSYFFVSTFIADHIRFHAQYL